MNFQKLNLLNYLKLAEIGANVKKRNSKPLNHSGVITGNDETSENQRMLQLRKAEELNAHLEKLVKQLSNKLSEVIVTNNKFLSIIAHDLRSPFASILGALELINLSLKEKNLDEAENYIDLASDSANSTIKLLDDLITWTFSQNQEKSFNPVKIDLHRLLREEFESVCISARQKQINMCHSIPVNLDVTADLEMVKTIFRNLISNAIKYTNNNGEITVSASENKRFVEIEVRDNGIGISQMAQKDIFKIEGFYSTAGTNNEQGTGLGLILCKEFIELHGGDIWVESEPGKGSKFKFSLPHYV